MSTPPPLSGLSKTQVKRSAKTSSCPAGDEGMANNYKVPLRGWDPGGVTSRKGVTLTLPSYFVHESRF